MSRSVKHRIAAIERQVAPARKSPLLVTILGGFAVGPVTATAGGHHWVARPKETLVAFRGRVLADATAHGVDYVTFGGFPVE